MSLRFRAACSLLALITSVLPAQALAPQQPGGIIEGRVTGPNRRPLDNVRVTLTNDTYSPLSSRYTDGSGRFRFTVTSGTFYVEVDPMGQPFERHRERVEVNPAPFSKGNEIFRVDITLAPAPRAGDRAPAAGGVRFAQEVPEAARKEYERGAKLVKDKLEEGLAALRKAIELFPDYYDARELLGTELVKAGTYAEAQPILVRALEINPSGEASHYALGVLLYRTGKFAEAVASLQEAHALNSKSTNTTLYLGLALMRAGNREGAEVYLKRAYEMGATGVADLHLALASIYIDSKRNREAAAQLRLLIKEVPNLRDRDKIKGLIEKLEKS